MREEIISQSRKGAELQRNFSAGFSQKISLAKAFLKINFYDNLQLKLEAIENLFEDLCGKNE
ncbi:hypothetical protein [Flavobacterium gelatinilyticum]|uniref:hypothetical protein n=1 Tax=Flavobacterium gelatinilyticum TaxID=3003260 RepID=UPI0024810D10|nr:hypothetical protein [Flavobacterium gelatinilyticum]